MRKIIACSLFAVLIFTQLGCATLSGDIVAEFNFPLDESIRIFDATKGKEVLNAKGDENGIYGERYHRDQ